MRALVLAVGLTVAAAGPGGLRQAVEYRFEPVDKAAKVYTISVDENGEGGYREGVDGVVQPLHVSAATVKTAFAARQTIESGQCETHLKGIAQTGKKMLRSFDNDQVSECAFNYSDDAKVRDATDAFMAMVETLQMGEQLAHERRFDRLGLDATLDSLMDEVRAGRAIELQNIAPVLQGIVADERLMERVRSKAAHLLESAGVVGPAK